MTNEEKLAKIREVAEVWKNQTLNGSTTSVVLRDVGEELLNILEDRPVGSSWLGTQIHLGVPRDLA